MNSIPHASYGLIKNSGGSNTSATHINEMRLKAKSGHFGLNQLGHKPLNYRKLPFRRRKLIEA
jgi:hypothetical protein